IGQDAYASAGTVTVTPTTRTRSRGSITLTAQALTSIPTQRTITPTATTFMGTPLATGQTRFPLQSANLTCPFPQTGYPEPFGITATFNDFERGSGTAYLAEYFNGPVGYFAAARITRLEVVAARVILATPNALQYTVTQGATTPLTSLIAISE